MSKQCAKCSKTVYPTEELKCLDKVWHKMCFKCGECGMTLNMKNYKGYNKIPYCNAHYPTTKFTSVAETPENSRISKNTKMQSNLKYHEQFEKAKGQYIGSGVDLETERHLQNTRKQSGIAYHEKFEKEKGQYTSVVDMPEMLRLKKNQEMISSVKYHEEFEKMRGMKTSLADDPETLRAKRNMEISSEVEYKGLKAQNADMEARRNHLSQDVRQAPRAPPPDDGFNPSPYSARNQPGMSTAYSSQGKEERNSGSQNPPGSIENYDPMNDRWGSISQQQFTETVASPSHAGYRQQPAESMPPPAQPAQQSMPSSNYRPQEQQQPPQYNAPAPGMAQAPMYVALYDYEAQDSDEVGFREGDRIINSEPIDEGWMNGTVERTGQRGMLPSNYVELVR